MTTNQPADLISEQFDETPFYLRTRSAKTGYARTLEDALEVFASEDGYRLGITLTVTAYRNTAGKITRVETQPAIPHSVIQALFASKE